MRTNPTAVLAIMLWALIAGCAHGRPDRTRAAAPPAGPTVAEGGAAPTSPSPSAVSTANRAPRGPAPPVGERVRLSDDEWRSRLNAEAYHVMREQGTEQAFTGRYWNNHEAGTYHCAGCGAPLFSSSTKFESGTGWPSFYQPVEAGRVEQTQDESHGMSRNEVHCARCGGHLGHVFDDGPRPTGLRYCINSASLDFTPTRAAE